MLIGTVEGDAALIKSAENLPGVKTLPARQLNVADMLASKVLLLSEKALRVVESIWGSKSAVELAQ